MLAFVIPVKPRRRAASWPAVGALLERTLRSVCGQTEGGFQVLVVCHERPDTGFAYPRVRYVTVDFELALSARDPVEIPENPALETGRVDKGRKMFRGVEEARRLGATRVMFVDADDLVSNRLAAAVSAGAAPFGYYIPSGYSYDEGGRSVYVKRRNFHHECGTAFVFASSALPIPDAPEYDRGYEYYRFVLNHAYIVDKMRERGTPLAPLGFRAAIYTRSRENFFRKNVPSARPLLRTLLNTRPLTQRVRDEFGLYALPAAAPDGAGAA